MVGRPSKGFFKIVTKAGKQYLVKVRSVRDGEKVRQEFLFHVGELQEIRRKVCQNA